MAVTHTYTGPGVVGPTGPEGLPGDIGPAGIWPVGSVYFSIIQDNPAVKLGGGTWVEMANGEFNEVTPTVYLYRRTL